MLASSPADRCLSIVAGESRPIYLNLADRLSKVVRDAALKAAEAFHFCPHSVTMQGAFDRAGESNLLSALRSKLALSLSAARFFVVVALLLLIVSCARQQSIELSVDRAVLEDSIIGKPAMTVYLKPDSAHEFMVFTSKFVGRSAEFRFRDVTLAKGIVKTPYLKGIFQVNVLQDHVDGTLNESNAIEIAQKLSSGDAVIEARVAE
jgi:hypothetical protein